MGSNRNTSGRLPGGHTGYMDFRNKRLHAEVKWMTIFGWHWGMRPVNRQLIHKGRKP